MMKIKDIMTESPCYLDESATLTEAAQKMDELDCGFIPVGTNDRLTGIITDRDITIRAVAQNLSCDTAVSRIMTPTVLYCLESDNPDAVAKNMAENQVRRLVVLNDATAKRLVGVVSLCDIVNATKTSSNTAAQLIQGVSVPYGRNGRSRRAA
jgi:CBS domain-containing protein